MKIYLALLCIPFLALLAVGQSRIPGPGGETLTAVVNSIGPVDAWMTLGGTTAATNLTTTILNGATSTIGIANTSNWARTGATNLPAAAHSANCTPGGSVLIDGTSYTTAQTTLSWNFPNSVTNEHFDIGLANSQGHKRVVAMVCYTSNSGTLAGSGVVDFIRMNGTISGNVIAQLSTTSKCGGTFGVDLETIAAGTSNTACNTSITQGGTFWYVLFYDGTVPTCSLRVYDTSFNQVGSTLTAASNCPTGDITSVAFGNNEAGTSTGTANFENAMVRASGEPPVLHPQNTTQDAVFWAGQSHNNKTTAGTTVATTKALDVPANVCQVVSCSNENASGQTTGVTNTAGDTFTAAAAVKSAANAQSISQWVSCGNAAHTGQTYTCTFPSSSFSNIDAELLGGATSYDTGAVGNTASGANITSGSFTPSTSTGTNVYCAYIQAGQAITPGTNYYQMNSSSTNSMGCGIRTAAPNSSQTATGTHSNTSASMIVVGNYKP